ncbi:hypothetical protein EV426DRAFT_625400 [Tirmania nivea]|nr:hypothetical protein EV426DRAFT_625400 [Tirmania nivea]
MGSNSGEVIEDYLVLFWVNLKLTIVCLTQVLVFLSLILRLSLSHLLAWFSLNVSFTCCFFFPKGNGVEGERRVWARCGTPVIRG